MKRVFLFIIFLSVSILIKAQTREAIIKYDSSSIKLNLEDLSNSCYAKGIVRLSFKSEDILRVTNSELIFFKIFDSASNEEVFDFNDKDRFSSEMYMKSRRHYEYLIDSIFRKKQFYIINPDYDTFVNRADFPFKLIINSR